MIPLAGLDLTRWDHWPYFLGLLVSPLILALCLATFFGPGWFIGAYWLGFMSDLMPEEVQREMWERSWVTPPPNPNP